MGSNTFGGPGGSGDAEDSSDSTVEDLLFVVDVALENETTRSLCDSTRLSWVSL